MTDFISGKGLVAGIEPKQLLPEWELTKTLRIMKLTAILLLAAVLQVSAKGFGQEEITISVNNAPLEQVLNSIKKQSGFYFIYRPEMVAGKTVSIHVTNATLNETLDRCLKPQKLTYNIVGKSIVISTTGNENIVIRDMSENNDLALIDIKGKVVNRDGEPLASATVVIKRTGSGTLTDANGNFKIKGVYPEDVLVISYTGYNAQTIKVGDRSAFTFVLEFANNELDQLVIQAYGQTTKRLNTGNIAKISKEELNAQPISNPLAALQGRVPGLLITQLNGLPGSSFTVQLRGQSSIGILPGVRPLNDPLFIVDGVPLAGNNNSVSNLTSALANGLSPLNSINISDIESIEVLKDADATAIYGSRGANGVILITTKKGTIGKTRVDLNLKYGLSKAYNTTPLLNTAQYVEMRKEAFANDGITPTFSNAPDLLSWDTTRYTDWKKYFIGGTARNLDAQLSVSGGSKDVKFLLSGSYYRETTVFPESFPNSRGAFNANVSHNSANQKLKINFNAVYSANFNSVPRQDITTRIRIVPNYPSLYDDNGQLRWSENKVTINGNPIALMAQPYVSKGSNLVSNLGLSYTVFKGLIIRSSLGYNILRQNDESKIPISSMNPAISPKGSAFYGNEQRQAWIFEPQIEYNTRISRGKLNFLAGASLQKNSNEVSTVTASGYTSDAFLSIVASAPSISSFNNNAKYNYEGIFGRFTFNWDDKYLLNLTGRRDGSSRFGPGNQFGNFGALGAAWVFSNEEILKNIQPILSFGKIRFSYGSTGQDQIGDYGYLNLWSIVSLVSQYQGIPSLAPTRLFNPEYSWELTKKLEAAIDLGWFDDRIMISGVYYQNRTSNQLISYKIPAQAGFSTIPNVNFPATVQNSGFEGVLTIKPITKKAFSWTSTLTITIPRNKLLSFPGIENSSYSNLVVGKPLNIARLYHYTGVDQNTGLFTVEDLTGEGILNNEDKIIVPSQEPQYYGSFSSSFIFKNFELNIFFEGRRQKYGNSALAILYGNNIPGNLSTSNFYGNLPTTVLDRWQKPGDVKEIQRFSTNTNTAATAAANNYGLSDATRTDASFIKLRNLHLAYQLPTSVLSTLHVSAFKLYVACQNILTITNYKGSDPETQNPLAMPPLRTYTAGLNLTF